MVLTGTSYQQSWFSGLAKKVIILLVFSFAFFGLHSQAIDSTLIKAYPYKIGDIGFAVDSMEFYGGKVSQGHTIDYHLGMYNFGKFPVSLKNGKTNKFTEIKYDPPILEPGRSGKANISYEVVSEMPVGITQQEIAIESDDKENPYKFLYMIIDVLPDSSQGQSVRIKDTVPRLIFNHYNFDFGYSWHGKSFTHRFMFSNMGLQELVISQIVPSEGCKLINDPPRVIPSGGTGSIVVKVRTFGTYGVQHLMIKIVSNDPVNPLIILGLHGSVKQHTSGKKKAGFCYR